MEIFLILMIPLMGTTLGSLMVFLMRDKVRAQTEKLLLGFASGVMIAASVWSLLIPSMELSEQSYGKMNWVPAVVGFAAVMILLASFIAPLLPYMLSFAAGAMMYVVIEELIPEAQGGEHSNIGTIGAAAGFVVMMVLDCTLG